MKAFACSFGVQTIHRAQRSLGNFYLWKSRRECWCRLPPCMTAAYPVVVCKLRSWWCTGDIGMEYAWAWSCPRPIQSLLRPVICRVAFVHFLPSPSPAKRLAFQTESARRRASRASCYHVWERESLFLHVVPVSCILSSIKGWRRSTDAVSEVVLADGGPLTKERLTKSCDMET